MNNEMADVEMNPSEADPSDSQFGDEKEDEDAAKASASTTHPGTIRIIVAIGVLAVVIVAIVLGVVLPSNDNDSNKSITNPGTGTGDDASPVAAPTDNSVDTPVAAPVAADPDAPVSREDYLRNTVTPWSGADALADADSAASKALDWLTHTDPEQLTPFKGEKEVLQRYISAVLYYATNGPFWSPSRHRNLQVINFLSGQSVCDWNTFDGDDGIVCNEAGDITEFQFGTKTMKLRTACLQNRNRKKIDD
jgi:hypothetical protein